MKTNVLKTRTALFAIVGALLLSACSNTVEPDVPSLTGSWYGTTTIDGKTLTLDVQMTENGGVVNGNGVIVYENPIALQAAGTYNNPAIAMTLTFPGTTFQAMNFNGNLSADQKSMTGSMRGSGFDNFSITLRRQ